MSSLTGDQVRIIASSAPFMKSLGTMYHEPVQRLFFGRVIAHSCRRGGWCTWAELGGSAICTRGGEIGSVGTDGEITKAGAA